MKISLILLAGLISVSAIAAPKPKIRIRDAGGVISLALALPTSLIFKLGNLVYEDNILVLSKKAQSKPDAPRMMEEARLHNILLQDIHGFYSREFNRSSYDNQNGRITSYINVGRKGMDILGLMENAAWMGAPYNQFVFGMGAEHLGAFTTSYDVVGHEFTHAVINHTSMLKYQGQSGALNEHLADVFGEYFQYKMGQVVPGKEFLIGEGVVRGAILAKASALRNMLNPHEGAISQPATMQEIDAKYASGCKASSENDNCGVHTLSGIPNKIIASVVQKNGWESLIQSIYRVMTLKLKADSTFLDYKNELMRDCQSSAGSYQVCLDLEDAFQDAGL